MPLERTRKVALVLLKCLCKQLGDHSSTRQSYVTLNLKNLCQKQTHKTVTLLLRTRFACSFEALDSLLFVAISSFKFLFYFLLPSKPNSSPTVHECVHFQKLFIQIPRDFVPSMND
jgi:hypothetical protein